MTSPDDGRVIEANGISLYVEDHGDGDPVLLLHGWPDSARLWRHQVPVLTASGYRAITPDMRGFGRSEHPAEVRSYGLRNVVGDVSALLDGLGVQAAHVIGHDWGAAVAWLTAILCPDRVRTLTVISVPHPLAPPTVRQHEMAWYQLFFQFYGVAEATIQHDDWAWLRTFSRGDGDLEPGHRGPVPPRSADCVAELVPGEPRAAHARARAQAPAGHRADPGHLVDRGPLPRRRADAEVGGIRPGAVALRGNSRREPLGAA